MNEINYNNIYMGIVIQNNDPEHRGRVKVFIPHIAATLYKDWNETFQDGLDKHFVFPDKETNPDLDKVLQYLKETLPWAECAMPVFGGSASGRYNAYKHKGTTSDSNYWDGDDMVEGFRPSQAYLRENRISDAFYEAGISHNRLVNPNGNQYSPSDYSNLARGMFTIPNVGAHVWVFFNGGDPNYPVIFAAAYGLDDWQRIYTQQKESITDPKKFTSQDYPSSYENLSDEEKSDIDHNIKTFRSKHVINSNKHVIEMIDTDLAEVLKLTHYSGSFFEFNNHVTTRLATNNDQLMVLGDQFITIRRNQSTYVANYQENIIDGDRITKLGDFTAKRKWALEVLKVLKETHKYKRLFESTRAEMNKEYTSPLQTKAGVPHPCPVCGGDSWMYESKCVTCAREQSPHGPGLSPSTQDGSYGLDPKKWDEIIKVINKNQKKIIDKDLEANFGNGGDDLEMITGNKITTIGTAFNDMESFRVDPVGKLRNEGTYLAKKGTYTNLAAAPLVEYVDVDSVPGGDWEVTVGNKYSLMVGSKGIHIKTTGPLDLSGTIMNISAESLNLCGAHEVLIGTKSINGEATRVEIRGDIINLKPHKGLRQNVLIDGQACVRDNLKVVGGAHIEGELSYLHQTTVKFLNSTHWGNGPGWHTHNFESPHWTLLDKPEDVRDSQAGLNEPMPIGNKLTINSWWCPP